MRRERIICSLKCIDTNIHTYIHTYIHVTVIVIIIIIIPRKSNNIKFLATNISKFWIHCNLTWSYRLTHESNKLNYGGNCISFCVWPSCTLLVPKQDRICGPRSVFSGGVGSIGPAGICVFRHETRRFPGIQTWHIYYTFILGAQVESFQL
jgi:hypothetical protein